MVVATEVVATEAEVTLAEVIPEGSTEAGYQRQVVPAIKRFNAGRRLRVPRAWPIVTVVRSLQRLAAVSLLFAVPRQIATEVRQIQLQTRTETQLRKQRSRPGIIHRNSVRQLTIEGTIGTGGGTRMIGA